MNIYIQKIQELAHHNKYTKWYISICQNSNYKTGYGEKHHILPKCFKLGGETDKLNIVKLTAREHFVCHLLLTKMFFNEYKYKMVAAAQRFLHRKSTLKMQANYKVSSRAYQSLKETFSKLQSEKLKLNPIPNKGPRPNANTWNKGKHITHSKESNESRSRTMKGRKPWHAGKSGINIGFKKGNIPWNKGKIGVQVAWNKGLVVNTGPKEKVTCPFCNFIGGKPSMTRWHFNNCRLKPPP